MTRAIIVGAAGQDGQLLGRLLEGEGAVVLGIGREGIAVSDERTRRPGADILDFAAVADLVSGFGADEIYYLAAHHNSSEQATADDVDLMSTSLAVNVRGLTVFLESIRYRRPRARLFYAASSHAFGRPLRAPQDESTPFAPANIYGISKVAGIHTCMMYRRVHAVHASVRILYNHESWLRREVFVTCKIVKAVGDIVRGSRRKLEIAFPEAKVDWGYAPDYVDAMRRILRCDSADDCIVATGETHTVREFCDIAFRKAALDYRDFVVFNAAAGVRAQPRLVGNSARLAAATGWRPTVTFEQMVELLVEHEIARPN